MKVERGIVNGKYDTLSKVLSLPFPVAALLLVGRLATLGWILRLYLAYGQGPSSCSSSSTYSLTLR